MPNPTSSTELLAKAKFVFQGTVLKLKSTNVREVSDTSNTIVVRIDRVIQSPQAFQSYAGREITIRLGPGEAVAAGAAAVFYTNGWIIGQTSIAVQSVGHTPVESALMSSKATTVTPHEALLDQELQNRLATADVVVSGKVSSINLPEAVQPSAEVLGAAGTAPHGPISEHEPEWRDAIVDIVETHKGDATKKRVVIRFPSSNDVRWHKAPKFYPGQEGVFILHKARPADATTALHMATVTEKETGSPDAYTALHAADFQPIQKHAQIKAMVTGLTEPSHH